MSNDIEVEAHFVILNDLRWIEDEIAYLKRLLGNKVTAVETITDSMRRIRTRTRVIDTVARGDNPDHDEPLGNADGTTIDYDRDRLIPLEGDRFAHIYDHGDDPWTDLGGEG